MKSNIMSPKLAGSYLLEPQRAETTYAADGP